MLAWGPHLENHHIGESWFSVSLLFVQVSLTIDCKCFSPKTFCKGSPLCDFVHSEDTEIGLSHFSLSLTIQEEKESSSHPIQLTPLLHPSLTYQDGVTKRMVLASFLLCWLSEDPEVSAKPPGRIWETNCDGWGESYISAGESCATPVQSGAGEQGFRDTAGYFLFGISWGL